LLPTIDTGGEISSPNVPSGTWGTKSKSKLFYSCSLHNFRQTACSHFILNDAKWWQRGRMVVVTTPLLTTLVKLSVGRKPAPTCCRCYAVHKC